MTCIVAGQVDFRSTLAANEVSPLCAKGYSTRNAGRSVVLGLRRGRTSSSERALLRQLVVRPRGSGHCCGQIVRPMGSGHWLGQVQMTCTPDAIAVKLCSSNTQHVQEVDERFRGKAGASAAACAPRTGKAHVMLLKGNFLSVHGAAAEAARSAVVMQQGMEQGRGATVCVADRHHAHAGNIELLVS